MEKEPIIWTNVLLFSLTFAVAAIGVPVYAVLVGFQLDRNHRHDSLSGVLRHVDHGRISSFVGA